MTKSIAAEVNEQEVVGSLQAPNYCAMLPLATRLLQSLQEKGALLKSAPLLKSEALAQQEFKYRLSTK